jgi:Flp pilus assembly protein TadG
MIALSRGAVDGVTGVRGVRGGVGARGSVTAEFAAVLPAVALVLATALMFMHIAGEQLRLQDAVADAARTLARGDSVATATARIRAAVDGADLTIEYREHLVCATASASAGSGFGVLSAVAVSATSCALGGGR